jgi:hypothetical protein
MKQFRRLSAVTLVLGMLLTIPGPARAVPDDNTDPTSPMTAVYGDADQRHNLELLSNAPRPTAYTQSDLAFWGRYAFAGNYNGFRILDISDPAHPVQLRNVACHGAQGDVSVWNGLLFVSVDRPQTSGQCASQDTATGFAAPYRTQAGWEGIRIFDVRDPANRPPTLIGAVKTTCGSHTHTLVPDATDAKLIHLYIASYPTGSTNLTTDCQPPHGILSIVHVRLDNPAAATVTKHALDPDTLPQKGTSAKGCHDITVFLESNLAAGSCLGEGQLWDISNRANPTLTNPVHVRNANMAFWHSAALTWDGKYVAFGDEAGGGSANVCKADDPTTVGAIWFYAVQKSDGRDELIVNSALSHYKLPRAQAGTTQNCVAHNFNFLTRRDRHILVSAWFQGGTSVVDVTNPRLPTEIAYYDPAPLATSGSAGQWSTYWYNGFIYANDRTRGVDIFMLRDAAAVDAQRLPYMNPQTQAPLHSMTLFLPGVVAPATR